MLSPGKALRLAKMKGRSLFALLRCLECPRQNWQPPYSYCHHTPFSFSFFWYDRVFAHHYSIACRQVDSMASDKIYTTSLNMSFEVITGVRFRHIFCCKTITCGRIPHRSLKCTLSTARGDANGETRHRAHNKTVQHTYVNCFR